MNRRRQLPNIVLLGVCAVGVLLGGCAAQHPHVTLAATPPETPTGSDAPIVHPRQRTVVPRWSEVVIRGRRLSQVTLVTVGGEHTLFTKKSDSVLSATVPAWPGEMVLHSPHGNAAVGYFDILPEIQWFEPEVGPIGTKVTIHGWGLYDVRSVTFNRVPATFQVEQLESDPGAGRIIAAVPGSAGDGNIAVVTRGGRAEFDSPFRVLDRPLSAQQVRAPPELHCAQATTLATRSTPIPLFAPLVVSLQRRTCVSVRLPTVIEQGWYAVVDPNTNSNGYAVNLTADPSCNRGAHICTGWIITGDYAGLHPPPLPGKPVRLANGSTAYYERSRIFAYPSNATLTWLEGDYMYSIASKGNLLQPLLDSANSMVLYSYRAR